MNKTLLCTAIAGVLAATTACAEAPAGDAAKEKCYGVAKAGKNDCNSADGKNSCAGSSTRDNNPNDWKYVGKGKCVEMGGSLTAGKNACPSKDKNACKTAK